MSHKWTSEEVAIITEKYASDGPSRVATELGRTMWAVIGKARWLGLESTRKCPPKGFKWTEENLAVLKERYERDGGPKTAEFFGLSLNNVQITAAKHGLHTNAGHEDWGRRRAEQSESCDIRYFDKWTPSMAYILGFVYADGSVNKAGSALTFGIQRRDEAILQFIREELKGKSPIRYAEGRIDKRGSQNQPTASFYACSKVLCNRLAELGVHHRKTYRDDPFPNMPDECVPHFIRGYFDGDGTACVTARNVCTVGFVGTREFVEGLRTAAMRLAQVSDRAICLKGAVVTITWTAWSDIRKFYDFIYPEGFGFCLERKRKILAEWLEQNPVQPKIGRPVGVAETKPRKPGRWPAKDNGD